MTHCPTAVDGAKVAIADLPDGIAITVTARSEPQTSEIREDARHLAAASSRDPAEIRHTGQGEGGGALGKCVVVLKDTTVTTEDVEGGAKIIVKPTRPEALEWLRREVRERHAKRPM